MEGIYTPNDQFDFSKISLTKPTTMSGGNYFIRFSYLENPLYIQPPKSTTKQGILKIGAGKRYYSDLLFSNENESFIRWMENLEAYCQKGIYDKRSEWFDGDMEMHDIENYFTPSMKSFKSGKYYLVRVNISSILGKPVLKIYDENENIVDMETITDNTRVMTILEVQGIKCSAKSFQIEIELKQMLVLKPTNVFDKCLLTVPSVSSPNVENPKTKELGVLDFYSDRKNDTEKDTFISSESSFEPKFSTSNSSIQEDLEEMNTNNSIAQIKQDISTVSSPPPSIEMEETKERNIGIEEIEFDLEELPKEEIVQLKERKEVYYEIYKQAVQKAKLAREMAISAYLEAKQIKKTYMIQDIDSDESDLEVDEYFSTTEVE